MSETTAAAAAAPAAAPAAAIQSKAVKDYGVHEDRNKTKRRKMEDAASQVDAFNGEPESAYFGVFDGHSGADAAKYCATNLHTVKRKRFARWLLRCLRVVCSCFTRSVALYPGAGRQTENDRARCAGSRRRSGARGDIRRDQWQPEQDGNSAAPGLHGRRCAGARHGRTSTTIRRQRRRRSRRHLVRAILRVHASHFDRIDRCYGARAAQHRRQSSAPDGRSQGERSGRARARQSDGRLHYQRPRQRPDRNHSLDRRSADEEVHRLDAVHEHDAADGRAHAPHRRLRRRAFRCRLSSRIAPNTTLARSGTC
jgi:hypothetical protein